MPSVFRFYMNSNFMTHFLSITFFFYDNHFNIQSHVSKLHKYKNDQFKFISFYIIPILYMCKMCYLFGRKNIYIVQDHVTLRVILINITPPYKFYWINILKISFVGLMLSMFLTHAKFCINWVLFTFRFRNLYFMHNFK